MIRHILTAAGLSLCLAGAAVAADAPAAKPAAAAKAEGPSAARLNAAEALMNTGIADQFLNSEKIVDAVVAHVKMREPDVDPDTLKTIRKILIEEFDANKHKLLHEFTVMYAANFTVDDLHAMADFYKSKAGQHLLDATPKISAESSQLIMPFMYHAMSRMREELMAQMAAKEKAEEKATKDAEKKASSDKIAKSKADKAKADEKTGEDNK